MYWTDQANLLAVRAERKEVGGCKEQAVDQTALHMAMRMLTVAGSTETRIPRRWLRDDGFGFPVIGDLVPANSACQPVCVRGNGAYGVSGFLCSG